MQCRIKGQVEVLPWAACNGAQRAAALQRHCTAGDAPLLLQGAASDWAALQEWNLGWLARQSSAFRCLHACPYAVHCRFFAATSCTSPCPLGHTYEAKLWWSPHRSK